MKPWIRLTLITMTVGGGFAGFAGTLQSLFHSSGASTLNLVLMVVFMGLYVFVAASGLLFVHDPTRTGPLLAALAIQIPSISSSIIVYKFAAGLEAFIIIGSTERERTIGAYLGWDLLLGSSWRFAVQHDNPLRVGVNVAALAILALLWQTLRPATAMTPKNHQSVGHNSPIQTP
jgi:hypothetical protein